MLSAPQHTRAGRRRLPLAAWAGLLILAIAALAALNLRLLVNSYEQASRSLATLSALEYGHRLTAHLARQPLTEVNGAGRDRFRQAVELLRHLEPALGYVSILENDVVLFHYEPEPPAAAVPDPAARTAILQKKLLTGSQPVPVMVFSRQVQPAPGRALHLQVALKKELLEREQAGVAVAVAALFKLSLLTIGAAFGVCLLAILGLMRREQRRDQRQRQNEHLAFAGAVASSIIHDFRNPMSAMRLDAQLLQQESVRPGGGRPERMRELAERINATIERLDILLLEFLLITRPDAVEREQFDINAGLRDDLDLLQTRLEKAGLRVSLTLAPGPLPARGYPVQFKRALLNILNNAEHFAPAGSTITARTLRADHLAIVEITDEGPGVAPRDRERIFDLFYSNRPGGTGIGLALARTAVENCGGTLTVRPGPGNRGSCFVIRVPLDLPR